MRFHLPNYVRAHRKRLHLTQRELAFLLGLKTQTTIAQHESLARLPQTKTLLKYELLFGRSIGEIFPRLRQEAAGELMAQARILISELEQRKDLTVVRKRELLAEMLTTKP